MRRPLATSSARRAFTLLEVMLALALSGVVIAAGMSFFWMISAADKALAAQFDDQVDFANTQRVLRRAFATLVASPPLDPPPDDNQPRSEDDDEDDEDDEDEDDERDGLGRLSAEQRAARERLAGLVADLGGAESLVASVLQADTYERPNFDLYYDIAPSGVALPRMELTLMRAPVAPALEYDVFMPVQIAGDKVRGSFDLIQEGTTLTLVWQPIDPPGLPVPLIRNLVWAEWWVLPRRRHGLEWVDVYSAIIEERYPVAVRLALWTSAGGHVDWLFETAVTTPNR